MWRMNHCMRAVCIVALLMAESRCLNAATDGNSAPEVVTDTLLPDTNVPADTHSAPTSLPPEEGAPLPENDSRKNIMIVRETRDTVYILDKTSFSATVRSLRGNARSLHRKGFGLSGGPNFGTHAIATGPVENLIDNDVYLSRRRFRFNRLGYEPFLMTGGMGFLGLGDGFRLGGGGMSGERSFSSAPFGGDSVIVLRMQVNYGGFMVEKAAYGDPWNFIAGGTIGGGSYKVIATEKNSSSWFSGSGDDDDLDDFDDSFENGNATKAGFFCIEPHCGFSYSFFPFFHLGINVNLPVFISVEKFNLYTEDFLNVNPGVYFKIIFGNLG